MHMAIGILGGLIIGLLAWRAGALSKSGALAATIIGGLIFSLGGIPWAVLLLTFFIFSSFLSHTFAGQKKTLGEKFSKGSQRDWEQVTANGGLGALLVIIHTFQASEIWPWIAFAGAMAAVNADTWATELGVLNPSPPRLITNFKVVEKGTSGGVSLFGSLASLGAAAFIAFPAAIFTWQTTSTSEEPWIIVASTLIGGICGSLFDSILGASLQGIYYCPACRKETERHPEHSCGNPTQHIRGWRWLNNDGVNFATSTVGALVAIVIFYGLS